MLHQCEENRTIKTNFIKPRIISYAMKHDKSYKLSNVPGYQKRLLSIKPAALSSPKRNSPGLDPGSINRSLRARLVPYGDVSCLQNVIYLSTTARPAGE